ncbi:hypothetical protein DET0605 [Dehalococcoides mccartyi 195]|uniref:Uncharacterized protein n=1 Tax=Dehalococcoides mccartyi (strain ATCC BAA-2266 / KCTC 15142 / 195) TaxID=243164 RepID=Q3Z8V2_DEHM1|nr:hypothetical protein DET0605 [Dehalococcoides mccartyi 195]
MFDGSYALRTDKTGYIGIIKRGALRPSFQDYNNRSLFKPKGNFPAEC